MPTLFRSYWRGLCCHRFKCIKRTWEGSQRPVIQSLTSRGSLLLCFRFTWLPQVGCQVPFQKADVIFKILFAIEHLKIVNMHSSNLISLNGILTNNCYKSRLICKQSPSEPIYWAALSRCAAVLLKAQIFFFFNRTEWKKQHSHEDKETADVEKATKNINTLHWAWN